MGYEGGWDGDSGCGHICDSCEELRKIQQEELEKIRLLYQELLKDFPEYTFTSLSAEGGYDGKTKYKGRIGLRRRDYKVVPSSVPPRIYKGAKIVMEETIKVREGFNGVPVYRNYHTPEYWIKLIS